MTNPDDTEQARGPFVAAAGYDTVLPIYTAPPADAGMREALERAHGKFCKIAGTEVWTDSCLDGWRRSPGALRDYAEQAAKEIDAALTAPGATTKSDGGVESRYAAACAQPRGVEPEVAPGPSDPSPTRSDVTVESLAAGIERSGFVVIGRFEAAILARALLDQFEIRRRP